MISIIDSHSTIFIFRKKRIGKNLYLPKIFSYNKGNVVTNIFNLISGENFFPRNICRTRDCLFNGLNDFDAGKSITRVIGSGGS